METVETKGKVCGYNKKTLVIVVALLVIIGGAFYAGAKYEKSKLSKFGLIKSGKNEASCKVSDSVAGEITAKTDNTITIKTSDGNIQNVSLSDPMKTGKKSSAMLASLAVGQQVVIKGIKNADGSFLAQSIKQSTSATPITPATPTTSTTPATQAN
jgi:hypothetical protein